MPKTLQLSWRKGANPLLILCLLIAQKAVPKKPCQKPTRILLKLEIADFSVARSLVLGASIWLLTARIKNHSGAIGRTIVLTILEANNANNQPYGTRFDVVAPVGVICGSRLCRLE